MKTEIRMPALAVAATLVVLAGCSGGSSDSNDAGLGGDVNRPPPASGIVPDVGEVDRALYPSNEEIAAANGRVDEEQAFALLPGIWVSVDPATDCATTYTFGADDVATGRRFSLTSLDQVAGGEYALDDFNGRIELEERFDTENFGSDCRGFVNDADALEFGVSFGSALEFEDQDTLILGRGLNQRFLRQ